jgi:hypothetical protein
LPVDRKSGNRLGQAGRKRDEPRRIASAASRIADDDFGRVGGVEARIGDDRPDERRGQIRQRTRSMQPANPADGGAARGDDDGFPRRHRSS